MIFCFDRAIALGMIASSSETFCVWVCACRMCVRAWLCVWEMQWERNEQAKDLFFDREIRYDVNASSLETIVLYLCVVCLGV